MFLSYFNCLRNLVRGFGIWFTVVGCYALARSTFRHHYRKAFYFLLPNLLYFPYLFPNLLYFPFLFPHLYCTFPFSFHTYCTFPFSFPTNFPSVLSFPIIVHPPSLSLISNLVLNPYPLSTSTRLSHLLSCMECIYSVCPAL